MRRPRSRQYARILALPASLPRTTWRVSCTVPTPRTDPRRQPLCRGGQVVGDPRDLARYRADPDAHHRPAGSSSVTREENLKPPSRRGNVTWANPSARGHHGTTRTGAKAIPAETNKRVG